MLDQSVARSNRADVRNPVLAMPEVLEVFAALPPDSQAALRAALQAMCKSFRARGTDAWAKHKHASGAYWKVNAIYARHLALAIPKASPRQRRPAAPTDN